MTMISEIRNFSLESADSFYYSQPNVMLGAQQGFIHTIILRQIATPQGFFFIGNANLIDGAGYYLIANNDAGGGFNRLLFTIFQAEGDDLSLSVDLSLQPSKHQVVHCVFYPNTDVAEQAMQIWVNGVLVANRDTSDNNNYFPNSGGRYLVGGDGVVEKGPGAAYCGSAFRLLPADLTYSEIITAVTNNAREIMKRGHMTDVGLSEGGLPEYTNMYSPDINNGVPSVLTNRGTAAGGALSVEDSDATLIATAVVMDWADVNVIDSEESEEGFAMMAFSGGEGAESGSEDDGETASATQTMLESNRAFIEQYKAMRERIAAKKAAAK